MFTIFPQIRPRVISFSEPFIQRSQYIRLKVTEDRSAGIIRILVLFEGGSYMSKYDIHQNSILLGLVACFTELI
jgi:hypothetical protein